MRLRISGWQAIHGWRIVAEQHLFLNRHGFPRGGLDLIEANLAPSQEDTLG